MNHAHRASPVRHVKAHRESLQIVARRAPLLALSRTDVPLIESVNPDSGNSEFHAIAVEMKM
ncbi:hypothetical protein [Caballeronia sp. NK8]|uniref:hypothetical protein n=1 Tax=Caballeronia sp. NK8 TaxID=140098 RepID=UPI001BD1871F|nr:hypothetical protein [Caballeronia sp. NK8]